MINMNKLRRIAEIRNDISGMSNAMRDELYLILKTNKNRTISAATIQTLYWAQNELEGMPILYFEKMYDALVDKYKSPYLYILDIFQVKDDNVFVTGYIIGEPIRVGEMLLLEKADGRDIKTQCISIDDEHPSRVCTIQIHTLTMSEVSQGDRLVKL